MTILPAVGLVRQSGCPRWPAESPTAATKQLADRIWRDNSPGDIDIRMAYYGTPFIDPGAQGAGDVDLDTAPLPDEAEELTEQLALAWLAGRRRIRQRPQRPTPGPKGAGRHRR